MTAARRTGQIVAIAVKFVVPRSIGSEAASTNAFPEQAKRRQAAIYSPVLYLSFDEIPLRCQLIPEIAKDATRTVIG